MKLDTETYGLWLEMNIYVYMNFYIFQFNPSYYHNVLHTLGITMNISSDIVMTHFYSKFWYSFNVYHLHSVTTFWMKCLTDFTISVYYL